MSETVYLSISNARSHSVWFDVRDSQWTFAVRRAHDLRATFSVVMTNQLHQKIAIALLLVSLLCLSSLL